MKVHLVDGTYELFRSFYGAPTALSPSGREVGAIRGVLRSLLSLVRQKDVTHVGCAFDHIIESFRNDLFADYKTSEGVPPELLSQFALAEQGVGALGLVVWPMIEFEADDALATAARRYGVSPGVEQVVLCSPDKDLAQCVDGQRVVCLDRRRQILLDEEGVKAKFGVPPASMPDWLALVGDSADGYPGIRGWGAKSAAAVLARYARLEDIPDDERQWDVEVRGKARLARGLRDHRQDVLLYRRLARLRTDVPLEETLEDLEWRGARRTELEAFVAEIGDDELLGVVHRWKNA